MRYLALAICLLAALFVFLSSSQHGLRGPAAAVSPPAGSQVID
jgi:hypothetical protein